MRQIIIKHIIQLNQENSLHQYKKRELKSRRLKEVVEISQSMLKGDYEGLRKNRMICAESFKIAAIFTHTDIKEEDLLGGDEINMCVAMDQLFQRMRNEGESIGIEKGRQEENKVL